MNERRLTHRVFLWDMQLTQRYRNTWCGDAKHIFEQCGIPNFYNISLTQTIAVGHLVHMVKSRLVDSRKDQWYNDIQVSAKLRTYRTHKSERKTEAYLDRHMTIRQRSAIARFRCGSFPLAVELGRYRRPVTPLEDRVCQLCDNRPVEDERHFFGTM